MKRHELWRLQYRQRRYLEHLSEQDLQQRAKDILCNITVLTDTGKIGLHPVEDEGGYWIEIFTHLLEEFQIRFGPFPAGFTNGFIKEAQIITPTWPDAPKSVIAIKDKTFSSSPYLVKYGKECHVRKTLEKGVIRIAPASFYADPSLNAAIKDNELEISIHTHPSDVYIEHIDKKSGVPTARITPFGNVTYTLKAPTNYYVYCLSSKYIYRAFDDFEADCALLIKEPREFLKRLFRAFSKKLNSWRNFATAVTYIDPMNTHPSDLDVFFCKHFRYAYQKEYRAIWLPPSPEKHLEPVMLELGNLQQICELVRIPSLDESVKETE